MIYVLKQYHDTVSEALSLVYEEAVINPVILVHTGVYREESLFIDYSATVLGAGICYSVLCYCLTLGSMITLYDSRTR